MQALQHATLPRCN